MTTPVSLSVSVAPDVDDAPNASKGRRVAFGIVTVVLALGALGGLFGIGVVVGWFDTDMHGIHRVHDIGFGILFGVLLATALTALARHPERRASMLVQVVAVAVAVLLAGAVSEVGGFAFAGVLLLVVAAALYALHPDRQSVRHAVRRAPRDLSRPMLAVVVVGAVPIVTFALTMARLQRMGPSTDPHVSQDHWATMAAMAFALVLTGALASLRLPGWRLSAWCAGIGVAVYGVASIVFHHFPGGDGPYPGSRGIGWGLVAVVGGLAFVGLAERIAAGPSSPVRRR